MANDRVMIRCDGCGAWKMLIKFFPGDFSTRDNGILEWIDSHGPCHFRLYDVDLANTPGFSLFCEGHPALDPKKQNAEPSHARPSR